MDNLQEQIDIDFLKTLSYEEIYENLKIQKKSIELMAEKLKQDSFLENTTDEIIKHYRELANEV